MNLRALMSVILGSSWWQSCDFVAGGERGRGSDGHDVAARHGDGSDAFRDRRRQGHDH